MRYSQELTLAVLQAMVDDGQTPQQIADDLTARGYPSSATPDRVIFLIDGARVEFLIRRPTLH